MYNTISLQAKAERTTFEQEIILPNGKSFNHRDTVKMISCHSQGEYYLNDNESDIFYPLGMKRSPHFAKKLDTDTKDYEVIPEGDAPVNAAWIANIKLRTNFRDSGFALDINDNTEHCADYGSSVMKRVTMDNGEDGLKLCNLLYLWFDPSVESIYNKTVIELHQLTEMEIRAKKSWKDVDKAIENAEQVDNQETMATVQDRNVVIKYKIWERVGEFQKQDSSGNFIDKTPKYYHTIFCGLGEDEVILFEDVIKPEDSPYLDFHISKYKDRWLRVGVYERLFGLQRLVNDLVNYDRESALIASLIMFRSKDKALIGRNVMEEAFSGMILDTNSLDQIGISNQAFNEFITKLIRYEIKADELCMTPEVITGDKAPSNATFHGQALMTNVANDAFKNARDRIGFVMADFILKKKLPKLMAKWNTEDVLEIAGDEEHAKIFDYHREKFLVNDFIMQEWAQGRNPDEATIELFKQRIAEEAKFKPRRLEIKGLFKGFKYGLKLNPTGENVNKEQRNEVFTNVENLLVNVSPTAFQQVVKKHLEFNGISGIDIPIEELQLAQQNQIKGNVPQPKTDKLAAMVNTA